MEWEIVTVIIALVGLLATVTKPNYEFDKHHYKIK